MPSFSEDNRKTISIMQLIGGGYERAWFTNCKARYRWFVGGRNTKKSFDIIGFEPIFKILSDKRRNILMVRANDKDNRDSTFAILLKCIGIIGIMHLFKIRTSPLEIEYKPTGQKILFRGMNDPQSITSITTTVGYLTDVYIEEAFQIKSFEDFRILDGSLRAEEGIPLQITGCLNGWDGESWINSMFFKGRLSEDFETLDRPDVRYMDYYDPNYIGRYGRGLYLHRSTYKINEFRDKVNYDAAMQELKRVYPQNYAVEALGLFGVTTGKVYTEFNEQEVVIPIQKILGTDEYGKPYFPVGDFAIGIDTGLSNGEGKVKTVKRGENAEAKVKSATAMTLGYITADSRCLITVDEYFHSNNPGDNMTNTDNRQTYTEPEMINACVNKIWDWMVEFNGTRLMQGQVKIYVDNADIGFRQLLDFELRRRGIFNCEVYASSKKKTIRTRVAFTNLLMAYKEFFICDRCKNLIREMKNSRKGDKGEARSDGDDHTLNSSEYNQVTFYERLRRWQNFKER